MRTARRIQLAAVGALIFGATLGVASMDGADGGERPEVQGGPIAGKVGGRSRSAANVPEASGDSLESELPREGRMVAASADRRVRASKPIPALAAFEHAIYTAPLPDHTGERAASSRSIELRINDEPESGPSVRIQGRDPEAPRPLWLWRIETGGAVLHARGESRADGSLAFARAILPRDGLELIAAPAGARPDAAEASELLRIPGRRPRPPVAEIAVGPSGEWLLRVSPREPMADIVLADAMGRELAWVRAPGVRGHNKHEIVLDDHSGAEAARVAHEFPNGSRSDWRNIESWIHHEGLE